MKVSIITICYNRKETIASSIESVLSQDYHNIEYIVIDGNSTDGTKEIIKSYDEKISTYISEPDKGMYDALNKGLKIATGEIIGLMHSDDEFYDNEVISRIVAMFKKSPSSDGIYGNGIYVTNDKNERIVRDRISGIYDHKKIESGWLPLHPTVYIKKEIIEKFGYYNLDFKIASDTEFLLRYLFKRKINLTYVNSYVVKMRIGGLSTSRSRAFKVFYEDYRIYKYHGLPGFSTVFKKKLIALRQYFY